MSVEENKRLVLQFIEYLELQDYDKLADIMSETFTWVVPARGEALKDVPKVRDKALSMFRMKANRELMRGGMRLTPLEWTIQGDRVALEAEGTVVWNTGQVYNNLYHLAFVIRDGKLEKFTEYCDYLYAWETNPLLPKPGNKS